MIAETRYKCENDMKNLILDRLARIATVGVLLGSLTAPLVPASAQDAALRQQAIDWYDRVLADDCRPFNEAAALFDDVEQEMPGQYDLTKTAGNRGGSITLFEFLCDAGAYNIRNVYVEYSDGRFRLLSFASPAISVDYASDADNAAVSSITITGFDARLTVTNSEFDPSTAILKETAYWRGVGDASNETWWRYYDGRFVLERFLVDASYDGEINPQLDVTWPRTR